MLLSSEEILSIEINIRITWKIIKGEKADSIALESLGIHRNPIESLES
jgi:hypothetical protein